MTRTPATSLRFCSIASGENSSPSRSSFPTMLAVCFSRVLMDTIGFLRKRTLYSVLRTSNLVLISFIAQV